MNAMGREWEREQGPVGLRVVFTPQCRPGSAKGTLRRVLATLVLHGIRTSPGVSSLDFLEGWWFVEVI